LAIGTEALGAFKQVCTASFSVKGFEPPTISRSANPNTVTSVGISPQNRPLTYSYSTSGGSVNGNGATGVYSSTGAPTGAVGITCNLTDDKKQTAGSEHRRHDDGAVCGTCCSHAGSVLNLIRAGQEASYACK
jgi:hypothetical protein